VGKIARYTEEHQCIRARRGHQAPLFLAAAFSS
jgi:RNA:NAD 2'-phosphotransferase (TPT1/KptA family)